MSDMSRHCHRALPASLGPTQCPESVPRQSPQSCCCFLHAGLLALKVQREGQTDKCRGAVCDPSQSQLHPSLRLWLVPLLLQEGRRREAGKLSGLPARLGIALGSTPLPRPNQRL